MVDIIIPIFNRLEHTVQTIQSLLLNTDCSLYRLYVIDDRSTEAGMWDFLESLPHDVTVFRNAKNMGPAWSRNYVCDHIENLGAQSSYLYHSDNDVYFKPEWLTKLVTAFELINDEVLLLGGGCHPYLQNNSTVVLDGVVVGIKDAVSGYSQLMSWETWKKYGPFSDSNKDSDMKIMGSEDWAFCQEIIKDGYKVGSIEPEVVIATGKTNTYGEQATGHETFGNSESDIIIK